MGGSGEGARAPMSWLRPCAPTNTLMAMMVAEMVTAVEELLEPRGHCPVYQYCQQHGPFFFVVTALCGFVYVWV